MHSPPPRRRPVDFESKTNTETKTVTSADRASPLLYDEVSRELADLAVSTMAAGTVSMTEPVCLIESDDDGKLRVVRSALDILDKIDQPVAVVAIVGLYRTGKSYLMNKLAGVRKGFALGSTIQSKTKGIWMWCVPHPRKPDHTLVLLDTEGLGDVEKGDEKNDNWIFAMAVLLSSTLVYNSKGTIDNMALEKLHYVTELTEHIKVKSNQTAEDSEAEYMRYFPSFVWAVRDFTLQLELDGNPITADEYLENALKILKGNTEKIRKFNEPRHCLRNYFSQRWCFVFETPANSEKMKRMEELTDAELDTAFVQQAGKFTDHIYTHSGTKTLKGGIIVNGQLLGNLAETYVAAIRSGQIPCLDNAVLALSEIENSRAIERARASYSESMRSWIAFPTETEEELSQIHAACESEAVALFLKHAFKDDEQQYQMKLAEEIQGEYALICKQNAQESVDRCTSLIMCLFDHLEDKISCGYYTTPGGYRKYCDDLQAMVNQYRCTEGRGVKAEEVLSVYLEEKHKIGQAILAADKSLTETEQRAEEEKAQRMQAERQKKLADEQLQAQQRMAAEQQRSYDENMRQLERKMEREAREAMAEHQRILQAKDREMQHYLQQGFENKVHQLQREINSLRAAMEQQRAPPKKKNCTIC